MLSFRRMECADGHTAAEGFRHPVADLKPADEDQGGRRVSGASSRGDPRGMGPREAGRGRAETGGSARASYRLREQAGEA